MNQLTTLEEATRLLSTCRTVREAKAVRDLAAAAKVYARQAELGFEAQNYAAEIKLRAERRAGEILREMALTGSRRMQNDGRRVSDSPSLSDLGIDGKQSERWQKVATVPDDEFEAYIATSNEQQHAITTQGALAPLMTSNSADWHTPAAIMDATVKLLGVIDVDPCAEPARAVPARVHFTEKEDGLSREWHGRVYMNPPYGDAIIAWVQKLCEQYTIGNVVEAVALVPARTDTAWWDEVSLAPVCFLRGRLKFSGGATGAPFPSAVIYLGKRGGKFDKIFRRLGHIYQPVFH